jgi:hypothetical protein
MCDAPMAGDPPVTRRRFLAATPVGAVGLAVLGTNVTAAAMPVAAALSIVPRSQWGPGLAPTGPIPDEPDVRFLLVHHSVNANTYTESAVPGLLTGIYRFHTGDKGWPDIAYNFFVDRFGGVWEGRTGSLERAKAADATGGSQGFAQLCCFLGDHSSEPPSAAAQQSMGALLGWLAQRHGVDLSDGARARFTSRGSNRYPAGSAVDVATVSGHRDVSQTACPGNAAYALVTDGTFRRLARGAGGSAPTTAPPPTTTPSTTRPPASSSTAATSTTSSPTSTSTTLRPATTTAGRLEAAPAQGSTDDGSGWVQGTIGAGVLAAATGVVLALRSRYRRGPS